VDKMKAILEKALSRRTFLAGAGGIAAASTITGLVGCGNSSSTTTTTTPTPPSSSSYTDADVLNFALNLEYLEAQFYLYAATGQGLSASDTAAPTGYTGSYTQGTVTVGSAAAVAGLTTQQQDIINEIAYEEQEHVRFLRTALGSAAVPMPSIDLSFFGPLATTAGITGPTFNPFSSFDYFLVGAFIFEDVGVTAYAGAAPLISSAGVAAGYLTAASGILAVEAYHAAYIRTAITGGAIAAGSAAAFPYITAANQVAALRAMLTVGNSGAPGSATGNTGAPGSSSSVETALALPTSTTTPSSIVAADPTNAIGFARTVNQVLHVVYGSPTVGVAKGGFFPNGANSIFATTTA
jgi:Ferritin-like domain